MEEQIIYYDVDGLTLGWLEAQMAVRGPDGYWAYAEWEINWTAGCDISLSGRITMPRHTNPDQMATEDRRIWEEMIVALLEHEREHLEHGRQAAVEIEKADCRGAYDIIDRWAAVDTAFDRRTQHGALTGVDLE